ncbi:PP2C family protein-serine/threonine phosphatase [Embleya scabrispora]|uniref:PP2C family protein-serine/threonine phosphatase n=1 Tax=Embleya scabrispora TaxID=159449 RepID=UPI001374D229|nr:PP2C family protein-serine/threonine phosphatase [Embleya scabrispora]
MAVGLYVAVLVSRAFAPDYLDMHAVLIAVPAVVAMAYRPWLTATAGAVALATRLLLNPHVYGGGGDKSTTGVSAAILIVTLFGCWVGWERRRQDARLHRVQSVAEVAQRALLRPVPRAIGRFGFAVRYRAAAEEASIGGDLYEVLETPYGVRVLLGDVRGKGLEAVDMAARTLGAFREAAYDAPTLAEVGTRVDRSLNRQLGTEDFVTAVMVELCPGEGTMQVLACGHPSPLLVRGGTVGEVIAEAGLPLGMGLLPAATARTVEQVPFRPGDVLLMHTDGVTEARNTTGAFYPLARHLATHAHNDAAGMLDAVEQALIAHVGGKLEDDAAMLAVTLTGPLLKVVKPARTLEPTHQSA